MSCSHRLDGLKSVQESCPVNFNQCLTKRRTQELIQYLAMTNMLKDKRRYLLHQALLHKFIVTCICGSCRPCEGFCFEIVWTSWNCIFSGLKPIPKLSGKHGMNKHIIKYVFKHIRTFMVIFAYYCLLMLYCCQIAVICRLLTFPLSSSVQPHRSTSN